MARALIFTILFCITNASLVLLYPFSFLFPSFWMRFLITLALYGLGTGIMLYLLFHPRNQWLIRNRSQVEGAHTVALTFDDGPDPVDTPRLLNLLREKNVKATFFVVGERARQHPEIVLRAWREGHLIGCHTWSHKLLFCFLPPWRLRSEIVRGTQVIEEICGQRPSTFRSPVGLRHPLLSIYLERSGLEYVSWRIRSCDTLIADSSRLERRILDQIQAGDIVLFHDRLPRGANAMLSALPNIIDQIHLRGLKFVLAGLAKKPLRP